MPLPDHWPLLGLRVRTPNLELRVPADADLARLASVAGQGIYDPHDPRVVRSPVAGWTDTPSPLAERSLLQYCWRAASEWSVDNWNLVTVVYHEGGVVGSQDMGAQHFAVTRAVSTGSWLGRSFQAQGLGKEMRQAVLHLAFAGLRAEVAYSAAWDTNSASLGISRALGYLENGTTVRHFESRRVVQVNLILPRERWEQDRRDDITIDGLTARCRAMFGLSGE